MKAALLRSGYVIESRVAATLRQYGWFAETNVAYEGSDGMKARELDLRAIRGFDTGGSGRDARYLGVELLIECVNNSEPVTVIAQAGHLPIPLLLAGCPQVVVEHLPTEANGSPGRMYPGAQCLGIEFHHYEDAEALRATQFCSFVRKKQNGEWMATHTDEHFASVHCLLESSQHFIDDFYVDMYDGRPLNDAYVAPLHFFYPILVLGGSLFAAHVCEDGGLDIGEVPHAILVTSAYQRGRHVVCPIDVVSEQGLPDLLIKMEREHTEILSRMVAKRDLIEWSRDHIAAHVPAEIGTTSELRRYLEP